MLFIILAMQDAFYQMFSKKLNIWLELFQHKVPFTTIRLLSGCEIINPALFKEERLLTNGSTALFCRLNIISSIIKREIDGADHYYLQNRIS